MSINSSSFNDSLIHPSSSSFSAELHLNFNCHAFSPSSFILSSYYITNISLLLPLCVFILHHGLHQWHHEVSTTSHSDCFTYHLAAMELINVVNSVCHCCGIYWNDLDLLFGSNFLTSLIWHGQTFFHMLTCLEHYLAVIHPITYLSLRKERGVRLRNTAVGSVWLLSFIGTGLMAKKTFLGVVDLSLLMLNLIVVPFWSVSVLRTLIGPGPGEQSGSSHQLKQRAFYTIVTILGVLVLRFIGSLIWTVVDVLKNSSYCLMMTVGVWLNLPSSLVLPLLFLHRAGKLVCCKKNR